MSLEAEPTPPPLFTYVIESQNADTVHIRARNWMVAFGMAMNLLRLQQEVQEGQGKQGSHLFHRPVVADGAKPDGARGQRTDGGGDGVDRFGGHGLPAVLALRFRGEFASKRVARHVRSGKRIRIRHE